MSGYELNLRDFGRSLQDYRITQAENQKSVVLPRSRRGGTEAKRDKGAGETKAVSPGTVSTARSLSPKKAPDESGA